MWSLIKSILLRIAAVRLLFKIFGGFLLLPLAFLLKVIGLPVLMVILVLAMPVLFMLFVFGLPIFLVLIVGGAILGLLGAALSIGMVVLKFAILFVLPLWVAWKLATFIRDRIWRRDPPTPPAATGDAI
jgi:hypothetical protein